MAEVRIATRRSRLAMAQARWVADRLIGTDPDLEVEFVPVSTSGDVDRTTPVTALTQLGAFVRAVQDAVLDGDADVAVHSCKDLPVAGPPGLVAVYPQREVPWDVLCGADLAELAAGARVGTGSPRRKAQLLALRPDLVVDDIRGNVDTRLRKVADGQYDAVVLAEAGLVRLGAGDAIEHRFSVDEMVPAPAQAALAVEAMAGSAAAELIGAIDDPATRREVEAERGVLAKTGAGCRAALGVLAASSPSFGLTGFVEDDHGPRRAAVADEDATAAVELLIEELGL